MTIQVFSSRIDTPLGAIGVRDSGGSGPPVVLRHGIFLDSSIWSAVESELSPDYRVLSLDAPGHGASGSVGRFTLADDATSVVSVLDRLGVQRASFVGHSWGGMTALRIAAAYPERVGALMLLNTPLLRPASAARARYAALAALAAAVGMPPWYGRRVAAALYSPGSLERRPELRDGLASRLHAADRASIIAAMRAVLVQPDDGMHHLGLVQAPLVVAAGVEDYVLPPEVEQAVRARRPDARFARLPGGHVSPQEAPDATARLVADFLRVWSSR